MGNDIRTDGNGYWNSFPYYAPPQNTDSTAPRVYGPYVPQSTQSDPSAALPSYVGTQTRPAYTANADTSPPTEMSQADTDALKLDLAQMGIDLVGIADPTPISDGSNTVISLFRGHWKDAMISAAAIVPYVGDAAKLAKMPKYLKIFERLADAAGSIKGPIRDLLLTAAEKVQGLLRRVGDLFGAAGAKLNEVVSNAIHKLKGPKKPEYLGEPYDPSRIGPQLGVDPRTIKPGSQGYLWNGRRLTPEQLERVRRVEQKGMDHALEMRGDRLVDGNHRLYIALGKSGLPPRPVDVFNHGGLYSLD